MADINVTLNPDLLPNLNGMVRALWGRNSVPSGIYFPRQKKGGGDRSRRPPHNQNEQS